MSDVSICYSCGYPIIFRFKPPQLFHIPSGWHCWSQRQGGTPRHTRIPTTTPLKQRKQLREKGEALYADYNRDGDPARVLRFVTAQLREDRGDVVRELLGYLSEDDTDRRDALVSRIVATPSWQSLVDRLEKAA